MRKQVAQDLKTPTTTNEPHLQLVTRVPTRITEGRDELNFAEFPLSSLTERPNPSLKTIVFEDKIFDRSKQEHITRKVTISGSDAYGLPTPIDEEVLLALIQLSKLQDFTSKRVYFTRYQLLNLLKWPPTGQSYVRLDKSLNRWMGVTMYYKNSWRDRKSQCWVDESFHMLETVKIVDGQERAQKGNPASEFVCSYFEWNEVVFRSFQNGNVKALNYDFFLSIESSVAKRLYRFLDKRFFHSEEIDFDLKTLAYEHVGLSRNTPTGDLKRKLNGAIDELEKKGYLQPTPKERRFVKQASGVWRVIFKRQSGALLSITESETTKTETFSLEERLVNFGIREKKASELIQKFPKNLIEEKLAVALWMKGKNDSRICANPAGYLVSSIEQKYEAPKQFKEETQASERKLEAQRLTKEREGREARKKREAEDRDSKKQQAIDEFWNPLPEHRKLQIETEALKQADPGKKNLIALGGKVGETAKRTIVDAYVLELLANG